MPVCKYLISDHVVTAEMEGKVQNSLWELFIFHISDHTVLEKYFCLPYFSRYIHKLINVHSVWLQQFSLTWYLFVRFLFFLTWFKILGIVSLQDRMGTVYMAN